MAGLFCSGLIFLFIRIHCKELSEVFIFIIQSKAYDVFYFKRTIFSHSTLMYYIYIIVVSKVIKMQMHRHMYFAPVAGDKKNTSVSKIMNQN